MAAPRYIVDDRTFLLALDGFFRDGMMECESLELLPIARTLVKELGVPVVDCPIEGYYVRSEELTEYFKSMRTLQGCAADDAKRVSSRHGLERLRQVCGSRAFGTPTGGRSLLPGGKDPVSYALEALRPDWKMDEILKTAKERSIDTEDYSLVGLAARWGDPVVVTALRETVVLYAMAVGGAASFEEPEYVWDVDRELVFLARNFIETVQQDIGFSIPEPIEENCPWYYDSAAQNEILGRCVRLGYHDRVDPTLHYHWAIRTVDDALQVEEFWDEFFWTTEMYQKKHHLFY